MHIWIKDSGASCHNANNGSGIYDITDIHESIQGGSGVMKATKKCKLHIKVR